MNHLAAVLVTFVATMRDRVARSREGQDGITTVELAILVSVLVLVALAVVAAYQAYVTDKISVLE